MKVTTVVLLALLVACAFPSVAQSWETPANVSNIPGLFSTGQSFIVDSRGNVHVVWVEFSGAGGYDDKVIYYIHNDTADGRFTQPARVEIPGYWLYIQSTQLTSTSDDTLHLAVTAKLCCWQSEEVIIYLSKPRGGWWSSPIALSATNGTQFCYGSAIVALPDDSVYVLYNDREKLYSRTRSASGVWGPQTLELQTPNDHHLPNGWARAVGDDLYVTYDVAFENHGGCYYKVRRNGAWSGWTRLSSYYAQTASRLTISRSPVTGELAALYGYDTGDGESFGTGNLNFDIYARFSTDNGETWTPQVRVSPGNSLDRWASAVYDPAGNLHVVWTGQVSQGDYGNLLYRKRSAGGEWGPAVNVSGNSGRTRTEFEAIRLHEGTLHLVYSNGGSPSSGPGYEDVWHTRMTLPLDSNPPGPVTNLTAAAAEERIQLSWRNPMDTDLATVIIRESTSGYPASPSSGSPVAEPEATPSTDQSYLVMPVSPNVTHYFSVFAKDQSGNVSTAAQAQATAATDVTPPASPVGFAATADYANNITLSWTNPADVDFRGTVIRMSTTGYPSGPGSGTPVANIAGSPGQAHTHTVTELASGTTCYFSAFSYDLKPNYSIGSVAQATASGASIGAVRGLPDGTTAVLHGKSVTMLETGTFYIEEPNRTAGIRVEAAPTGLALGDVVNVTGAVTTYAPNGSVPGERRISSPAFTRVSGGTPLKPVAMSNRAIGGAAQGPIPGVQSGIGLNNIGLLVSTWGKVTAVVGSYIWVDDGTGIPDWSGRVGVMFLRPTGAPAAAVGQYVSVSGVVVSSVPVGFTTNRRYIKGRIASDLRLWF